MAEFPNEDDVPHYRVLSKHLVDRGSSGTLYRMELHYPQIVQEGSSWIQEFNAVVAGWVAEEQQQFRKTYEKPTEAPPDAQDRTSREGEMAISYSVYLATAELLSIELTVRRYVASAAHANTDFKAFNLWLEDRRMLALSDLFTAGSDFLAVLSELCRLELEAQIGHRDEWLDRGTSPVPGNFKHFSITSTHLRFSFPPYQVGPYALGPQKVVIPYGSLKSVIDASGPLHSLLAN